LEGPLHHQEVRELYREASIFALSSFAEGVPVVLMEAMAMELPCVATRIMGIPELIRDGIDGILVDAGDEVSLAEALARLLDDPLLCSQLGKSGRARVLEKYDLRGNIKLLEEVFTKRLGWN
jgi:glycosyltransferase involved in cell wall biosynthesis